MKGAIAKAEELVAQDPSTHLMLQQYDNPANPEIHEKTTGPEIWDDTDGKIDVLVSDVGTGGTITGVSRYIMKTQGKARAAGDLEQTTSTSNSTTIPGEQPMP